MQKEPIINALNNPLAARFEGSLESAIKKSKDDAKGEG